MKNKIVRFLVLVGLLLSVIQIADKLYYNLYNGNDEIVFLDFKGTSQKDYLEVFKLSEFKAKYVFATLNLRGDWDYYRADLLAMQNLFERYSDSNLVFLYTVDSVDKYNDKYEWKKTIVKYNLKGYHIDFPWGYEYNLWEKYQDGSRSGYKLPKYMIVSDAGDIIDKWAPNPSQNEKLTNILDSLLNNVNKKSK